MARELDLRLMATPTVELPNVGLGDLSSLSVSQRASLHELASIPERRKLAAESKAMSDGSFPVRNVSDLRIALQAYGLARNKPRVKRFLIRRARALSRADLLPEAWGVAPTTAVLAAGDGGPSNGIMVAMYPPPEMADRLAGDEPGDLTPDDMHVTLAYLGTTDDVTPEQLDAARQAVANVANAQTPFQAQVQGTGSFLAPESDDPQWYSVDAPGLAALRTQVVQALESVGVQPRVEHDFTPHMTVRYGGEQPQVPEGGSEPWDVHGLVLKAGPDAEVHSFGHGFLPDDGDDGDGGCLLCGDPEDTDVHQVGPPPAWMDVLDNPALLGQVQEMVGEDGSRVEFVAAPGPCSLDRSAKHNWVENSGGLPNYICQVARAIARGGKSLESAIPIAIGTMKHWAAGGNHNGKKVSAAVQARAAAAVAEWEAKKAKAHTSSTATVAFAPIEGLSVLDLEFAATPPMKYVYDETNTDPNYQTFWDGLVKAGWKGDPNDKQEAINAPSPQAAVDAVVNAPASVKPEISKAQLRESLEAAQKKAADAVAAANQKAATAKTAAQKTAAAAAQKKAATAQAAAQKKAATAQAAAQKKAATAKAATAKKAATAQAAAQKKAATAAKAPAAKKSAAAPAASSGGRTYNRVSKGQAGGGRFAPGPARSSSAAAVQADPAAQKLYDSIMGTSAGARGAAAQKLSDADLKKASQILYSSKTSDPNVVSARVSIANEMSKRGYDVKHYGALGGGLSAAKNSPVVHAAPTKKAPVTTTKPAVAASAAEEFAWNPDIRPADKHGRPVAKGHKVHSPTGEPGTVVGNAPARGKPVVQVSQPVGSPVSVPAEDTEVVHPPEDPGALNDLELKDRHARISADIATHHEAQAADAKAAADDPTATVGDDVHQPEIDRLKTKRQPYAEELAKRSAAVTPDAGDAELGFRFKHGWVRVDGGDAKSDKAAGVVGKVSGGSSHDPGGLVDKLTSNTAAQQKISNLVVAKKSFTYDPHGGSVSEGGAASILAGTAEKLDVGTTDSVVSKIGQVIRGSSDYLAPGNKIVGNFNAATGHYLVGVAGDAKQSVAASAASDPDVDTYSYHWDPDTEETFRVAEDGNISVFAPARDEQEQPTWQAIDTYNGATHADDVSHLPRIEDPATLEAILGSSLALVADAGAVAVDEAVADVEGDTGAMPEEEPEEDTTGRRFRIPILIPEGIPSGDRRQFAEGALEAKEPPMPLLWQRETDEGHKRSVTVGRIDRIDRLESGGLGNAEGVFDTHADAQEAARQVRERFLTGVSGDVDKFESELSQNEHGEESMLIKHGRLVAATLVAKPAFQEATIEMIPEEGESPVTITASGGPLLPPKAWFFKPALDGPTMLTVNEEGRVFGHIAEWGTPHMGNPQLKPPRSTSQYRYFNRKPLRTAEGEDVKVGQLTLAGGHAKMNYDPDRAVKHYDDTNSAVADVVAGEDEFGIWVAGAMRPGVTPTQLRAFRASEPSGDWRMRDGNLELCAVCQVNVAGFPVTPRALIASGEVVSLVAAGMVGRESRQLDIHQTIAELQAEVAALRAEREAERRAELLATVASLRS